MLKGLGFGVGANYASEHKTLNRSNIGTFTLPSYLVFNSVISYTANKYNINLKFDNFTNEKYFSGMKLKEKMSVLSLGTSKNISVEVTKIDKNNKDLKVVSSETITGMIYLYLILSNVR